MPRGKDISVREQHTPLAEWPRILGYNVTPERLKQLQADHTRARFKADTHYYRVVRVELDEKKRAIAVGRLEEEGES